MIGWHTPVWGKFWYFSSPSCSSCLYKFEHHYVPKKIWSQPIWNIRLTWTRFLPSRLNDFESEGWVGFSSTCFFINVNKSTKWSKSIFVRDPRIRGPSLHIFCVIYFLVLDWETSIDPFVVAINDSMSFQKESSKKQSCFLEWLLIWFFSLPLYVFPPICL